MMSGLCMGCLDAFPAARKGVSVWRLCTRKRRLAYYPYNSRDGGYYENTDLLGNRANRHGDADNAVS